MKMVRLLDELVNKVVQIVLIIVLVCSVYALWDTWQVYNQANADGDLLKYKPESGKTADSGYGFEELRKLNPDVIGWLTIDDTGIDYPLVQGMNNADYLNRNVLGEYALSGSIFLDEDCSPEFDETYEIIYGHHMGNHVMFGDIDEFADSDFFDEHMSGTLYLPDKKFSLSIFALIETDAYDSIVYQCSLAEGEGGRENLISYLEDKAMQYREIPDTETSTIIGMSTCADNSTNGRLILYAYAKETGGNALRGEYLRSKRV
jgi:sortase B